MRDTGALRHNNHIPAPTSNAKLGEWVGIPPIVPIPGAPLGGPLEHPRPIPVW